MADTSVHRSQIFSVLEDGLFTKSIALTGGTPLEAMVGAAPLVQRKLLSVHNGTGAVVYWSGSEAGCTVTDGFPLDAGDVLTLMVIGGVHVWLLGSGNVRVVEGK